MKNKHNGGFSLIETLVAIAVLGIVVVPTCNSLITSYRLNQTTDSMLQSQLAVSSAVETMMAEGISEKYMRDPTDKDLGNYGWDPGADASDISDDFDLFPGVAVTISGKEYRTCAQTQDCNCTSENCYDPKAPCTVCKVDGNYKCCAGPLYYEVTVTTSPENDNLTVTTHIRAASNEAPPRDITTDGTSQGGDS